MALTSQLAISCSASRTGGTTPAVTHFLQLPICYYGNSSSPRMELPLLHQGKTKKEKEKDDKKHDSFSCQCTSALVLFRGAASDRGAALLRVGQWGHSRTPQLGPICSAPALPIARLCSLHRCRGHGDRLSCAAPSERPEIKREAVHCWSAASCDCPVLR